MSEYREGWDCDNCGNGWCVAAGVIPARLACIARDGSICGTYRFTGPCGACRREDTREALKAAQPFYGPATLESVEAMQ